MLSFKHFAKRFEPAVSYGDITEELNNDQKGVVNNWMKAGGGQRAKAISSHVIPPDQDKITVPFGEPAGPAEAHPDVKAHLEKHGYGNITDYRAGLVQDPKYPDKKNRQLKIGGVLAKTGASPEVTNAFNNDPNRAASRAASSGLSVTYSRHPYHVCGMSTGVGWASCMTMGDKGQVGRGNPDYDGKDRYGDGGAGVYSHYLKPDVDLGTHVAYLHRSDDPEAKRPLARIALKPFESSNGKGTILRPESKTYGTSDDAFGDAVKKWSENNFPADKNTVYTKNDNLYNDDNKKYVGSPETLFNSPNIEHKRAAFDKKNDVSSEMIHKGIKDKDIYTQQAAMSHPNATQEHVDAGINNLNLHSTIAERKDLTPEHIAKLAQSKDGMVLDRLVKNNQLHPDDISRLLSRKNSGSLKTSIIKHQNIAPEHLDAAIKDKDFMVRGAAAANPGATDEHLSKAMKDSPYVAGEALRNPNLKASHLMDYFDRKDRANTNNDYSIIKHPLFNSKHIDKAIEWNQPEATRKAAMEHEKITPEQLQKMADSDPSKAIRTRAARFLKAGKFATEAPKPSGISDAAMQRINRQDEIRRMENAEFRRRR